MTKTWRVALASSDGRSIDEHFGRARHFYVVDIRSDGSRTPLERREIPRAEEIWGHSSANLAAACKALEDCAVLLAARVGPEAKRMLEAGNISVYERALPAEDALARLASYFKRSLL
ncbi:hypothetical protein SDC9_91672 [bioreactor metagenome]|uniref:Dinitrogenase iron-molybdenum cofactor biosynthesis domain-containing protein n=1 Tax=bioreactor metagenome TaxID=1076179 RepID=A0A644ZW55_9ZZZZ